MSIEELGKIVISKEQEILMMKTELGCLRHINGLTQGELESLQNESREEARPLEDILSKHFLNTPGEIFIIKAEVLKEIKYNFPVGPGGALLLLKVKM